MTDASDILIKNLQGFWQDLVASVPGLILALLVIIILIFTAKFFKYFIKKILRKKHNNIGLVLGRLSQWVITLFGLFIALLIIFPSFKVGDFVAGLGIGSVAIGFAFKDILQNFLSGILILLTEPFKIGDQIYVNKEGFEGTVTDIQTRATFVKTYDGRKIVIPNSELFTGSVTVNTAFAIRRYQVIVGIGTDENIDRAKQVILEALSHISTIEPSPKPDVIISELGDYAIILKVRWWAKSQRSDEVELKDLVLNQVNSTLNQHNIEMPYPKSEFYLNKKN